VTADAAAYRPWRAMAAVLRAACAINAAAELKRGWGEGGGREWIVCRGELAHNTEPATQRMLRD